ncbi:hypothetical protein D3C77_409080 [compost metagenome]
MRYSGGHLADKAEPFYVIQFHPQRLQLGNVLHDNDGSEHFVGMTFNDWGCACKKHFFLSLQQLRCLGPIL